MRWADFRNPHLDAEGNALFIPALRALLARNFDRKYPAYRAREFVPINTTISPGANVIEWRAFSRVGMVKLITALADDLPLSGIQGERNFSPIRTTGGAYRVSLDEINAYLFEGKSLPEEEARAVRENYEQAIDRWAAYGDSDANLVGLLNIPNANLVTLANGQASGNKRWSGKTPQEKLDDIIALISAIRTSTKRSEEPTTVLMPDTQLTSLSVERYSDSSDITTLEFIQKSFRNITFDSWVRCEGAAGGVAGTASQAGADTGDRMVAYVKDNDHVEMYIPKELAPLPPEQRNLATIVNHHGRFGGVVCYRPLSVAYADGA